MHHKQQTNGTSTKFKLTAIRYLEVEYSIQYGEEGTYDTPPSPSTFEIQRIWLRSGESVIDVTEVNPAYLDFQFKRIEEEIEEELMNR